tara:strand:+ start:2824 stop:3228 length:405 start_codon:yes stop_codon:yes gene_type:complete
MSDNDRAITTELVINPITADKNAREVLMPKIKVEQDVVDFGEMNQDESIVVFFKIKNVGEAPLLIRSAKGSCGCTVADWPREPVAPEENSIIKVTFSSEKRKGKQNKTVSLVTNAIPSTQVLTIKGTVLVSKNN